MADPVEVLDFWLGDIGPDGWYAGGGAIDAECRGRFLELWQAAADGGLEHWIDGTVGTLAFLILTDQLPRNMHRDTAEAFSTDPLALATAKRALAEGWDLGAPEPERQFFYMPFEHSENLDDQDAAVALMGERLPEDGANMLIHAEAHRDIIRRFGRFPSRNAALGRVSTDEEAVFLTEGGYGKVVEALKAQAMR